MAKFELSGDDREYIKECVANYDVDCIQWVLNYNKPEEGYDNGMNPNAEIEDGVKLVDFIYEEMKKQIVISSRIQDRSKLDDADARNSRLAFMVNNLIAHGANLGQSFGNMDFQKCNCKEGFVTYSKEHTKAMTLLIREGLREYSGVLDGKGGFKRPKEKLKVSVLSTLKAILNPKKGVYIDLSKLDPNSLWLRDILVEALGEKVSKKEKFEIVKLLKAHNYIFDNHNFDQLIGVRDADFIFAFIRYYKMPLNKKHGHGKYFLSSMASEFSQYTNPESKRKVLVAFRALLDAGANPNLNNGGWPSWKGRGCEIAMNLGDARRGEQAEVSGEALDLLEYAYRYKGMRFANCEGVSDNKSEEEFLKESRDWIK